MGALQRHRGRETVMFQPQSRFLRFGVGFLRLGGQWFCVKEIVDFFRILRGANDFQDNNYDNSRRQRFHQIGIVPFHQNSFSSAVHTVGLAMRHPIALFNGNSMAIAFRLTLERPADQNTTNVGLLVPSMLIRLHNAKQFPNLLGESARLSQSGSSTQRRAEQSRDVV